MEKIIIKNYKNKNIIRDRIYLKVVNIQEKRKRGQSKLNSQIF